MSFAAETLSDEEEHNLIWEGGGEKQRYLEEQRFNNSVNRWGNGIQSLQAGVDKENIQ